MMCRSQSTLLFMEVGWLAMSVVLVSADDDIIGSVVNDVVWSVGHHQEVAAQ